MNVFPLDPTSPLCDAILKIVAEKPGLTLAELHRELGGRGRKTSLQHVYRLVSKLENAHILLKQKGKLSVNLLWVAYLSSFASDARKALLGQKNFGFIFPLKEGERRTFTAATMREVYALFTHLLVQLHEVAPEKYIFKFYSHAWWETGDTAIDAAFYRRIKEAGIRCFWLYGHDTPLDRAAVRVLNDVVSSRIAQEQLFPVQGYNLNVYGDSIIECIFPATVAKHLDMLFRTVTDPGEAREDLGGIFSQHAKYKVTVWRNREQAASLRKKMEVEFLRPLS